MIAPGVTVKNLFLKRIFLQLVIKKCLLVVPSFSNEHEPVPYIASFIFLIKMAICVLIFFFTNAELLILQGIFIGRLSLFIFIEVEM